MLKTDPLPHRRGFSPQPPNVGFGWWGYSSLTISKITFPFSSLTIMCAAHEYQGSYALKTISNKFNFFSSTIYITPEVAKIC